MTGTAFAWGREGHMIVADIAQAHLTQQAAAQVKDLLQDGQTLADVADWADTVRDRATQRWHFVNLGDDCSYTPQRDCRDGQCIIDALARQEQILADAAQPVDARRDALKYVVHLAGDIGQPLHTIGHGDKGGNTYQVNIDGRGTNLHKVWDTDLVRHLGRSAQAIAAQITPDPGRPIQFADAGEFDPVRWARQSCALVAAKAIYPDGHKITEGYLIAHEKIVREQLQKSGERLAAILNMALNSNAN